MENSAGSVVVPNVLAYVPERPRATSSVVIGPIVMLPVLGAVLVSWLGFPLLALPAGLAVAVWMYRRHRRLAAQPHSTLRVQDGKLVIAERNSRNERTVRLDDLLEVSLDTRTIERVQEAAGGLPELRFINATVSSPVDNARIELELEDESIFLTEHYTSHLDANEWFGKIRRFLRKNGWVPEDERP